MAKSNIESLFDSIAGDYDRLNHLLSLGIDKTWRRRALKHIVPPAESKIDNWNVLDIACGTGDFSIAIAKEAAKTPGTIVTGVDISEGMLAVMEEKVRKTGLEQSIKAERGDSEQMRFEDGSFDRATIAFGIRNFQHRDVALREILRVLKPGGRLVILELSVPSWQPARACYCLYFKHILPWIGGLVSGDKAAYRYLPASVLAFPPKDKWMKTMSECGFANVTHKSFTFGICRMYIGEKSL